MPAESLCLVVASCQVVPENHRQYVSTAPRQPKRETRRRTDERFPHRHFLDPQSSCPGRQLQRVNRPCRKKRTSTLPWFASFLLAGWHSSESRSPTPSRGLGISRQQQPQLKSPWRKDCWQAPLLALGTARGYRKSAHPISNNKSSRSR